MAPHVRADHDHRRRRPLLRALGTRAIDVYRRGDLNGGQKAAWILLMLIIPFIGLLIYVMIRPSDAQIAKQARR